MSALSVPGEASPDSRKRRDDPSRIHLPDIGEPVVLVIESGTGDIEVAFIVKQQSIGTGQFGFCRRSPVPSRPVCAVTGDVPDAALERDREPDR